jgi:g-D-glutamyl-meso-diaminopimelate peptidase
MSLSSKKPIIIIGVVVVIAIIAFGLYKVSQKTPPVAQVEINPNAPVYKIIGNSVQGRKIESYTYGKGKNHLLFVGGMHGGYEWNSVLLAYQFMDYLDKNVDAVTSVIPENVTVTIIPSINPDGVYKVIGKEGRFTAAGITTDKETLASGRFNANAVDLNRNFDCKWQPKGQWQAKVTSAGTAPFSEPESKALQSFVLENTPDAVIFWHSKAGSVYASECKSGILPATLDIMTSYSKASGYGAVKSFNAYPVTGDAEGWLASINIPAITVELKTHESIEWE